MIDFTRPTRIPALHPYRGGNGVLDVVGQDGLPFQVRRAFRIAQVPPGEIRAGHAHRTCLQILWSASGRWHVKTEAKPGEAVSHDLEEGGDGLFVPVQHWLTLTSSTRLDVLVVLCSEPYLEASYVRERAAWEAELADAPNHLCWCGHRRIEHRGDCCFSCGTSTTRGNHVFRRVLPGGMEEPA